MKNFFVISAYFILLFALSSCNKSNNEAGSGGNFISAIHSRSNCINCLSTQSSITYNYNSNKQLASIISSCVGCTKDNSTFRDSSLFLYNSEGQLMNIYMSNSDAGPIQNKLFVYDALGRIVKMNGVPLLPNLLINNLTFSYDANNRVIADSTHNGNTAEIAGFRLFEYDNNGNISKVSTFNILNGTAQKQIEENFTYNDKINPYYAIKDIYFYSSGDPLSMSKNIPVYSPNDFHYSYFSNGLPRQLVQTISQPGYDVTSDYNYIP